MIKNPLNSAKRITAIVTVAIIILILIFAFDNRLYVRKYNLSTEKIDGSIRLSLITDLHSCSYGEDQSQLVEAVIGNKPDVILLGGDIFDDNIGNENTESLIRQISEKFPCFYVSGNHEHWSGRNAFSEKMNILEKYNVRVLSGKRLSFTVNGTAIDICGIDDPDSYITAFDIDTDPTGYSDAQTNKEKSFENDLKTLSESSEEGKFTILLSHRPEYFDFYSSLNFDLVLCGHAHGGQWRIPFVLNGLYAPNQGFFPKFAGGLYRSDDMTMIVSRGLAKETTRIPRIFNRPELVIIDINGME